MEPDGSEDRGEGRNRMSIFVFTLFPSLMNVATKCLERAKKYANIL